MEKETLSTVLKLVTSTYLAAPLNSRSSSARSTTVSARSTRIVLLSIYVAVAVFKSFMQRKDVFRVISGLFGNISKSGDIWGEDFYRPSTVKIPRFANVIPNTSGMTRKASFPCIKY